MSYPTDLAVGDQLTASDLNTIKNKPILTAVAGEAISAGDALVTLLSMYATAWETFTGSGALTGYNSWTCHVNSGSDVSTITGNYATIRSGGNNAVEAYKSAIATVPQSGREAHLRLKFTEGNSVGRTVTIGFWSNSTSSYFDVTGISFTDTPGSQNVTIVYNGGSTASGSITVPSAGNSCYLWIDIVPNGASNVDISYYYSTTLTKPAAATGSATNKSPHAGNYFKIGLDAAADKNVIIDDIFLSADASTVKFYKSNATSLDYVGFVGFALAAASAAATVYCLCSGQVTLSGLVPGNGYYLSDTAGAVSIVAGTNSRKVGFAASATQLIITNTW